MPVTIGPFDNVPAPGDPIRSDWPQEISQFVLNGHTIAVVTNAGAVGVPQNTWTKFGIGAITLAQKSRLAILALAGVGSLGGDHYFSAGFDNTQAPAPVAHAKVAGDVILWMSHPMIVATATAGNHNVECWANVLGTGGSIRNMQAIIIALPIA